MFFPLPAPLTCHARLSRDPPLDSREERDEDLRQHEEAEREHVGILNQVLRVLRALRQRHAAP